VIRTGVGDLEIAIRKMDWEEDARAFFAWAVAQDVSSIDLRRDTRTVGPWARDAGLEIACVDLLEWDGLGAPSADDRARAAELNEAYIRDAASLGVSRFLLVTYAEDERDDETRVSAFADGFRRLEPVLRETGSKIAIEPIPRADVACWRPQTFRQLSEEAPGGYVGINFDPSHLVRARIDPFRFLQEFGDQITHCHAKDTERVPELEYEWGSEAAYDRPITRFSGRTWRYVLPGMGDSSWTGLMEALAATGYQGRVSIEPEDDRLVGVPAIREATATSCRFLRDL